MSNVISFNTAKEQLEEKKQAYTLPNIESKEYIEEISILISYDIMSALDEMGYPLEDPNVFRDIVGIVESIKSGMYRMLGQEYYYQKVIDAVVQIPDDKLPELMDEFIENMVDIYEE